MGQGNPASSQIIALEKMVADRESNIDAYALDVAQIKAELAASRAQRDAALAKFKECSDELAALRAQEPVAFLCMLTDDTGETLLRRFRDAAKAFPEGWTVFGLPGRDYSEAFSCVEQPLYAAPVPPAVKESLTTAAPAPAAVPYTAILCKFCAGETMHVGDICYGCAHKSSQITAPPAVPEGACPHCLPIVGPGVAKRHAATQEGKP